MYATRKLEYDLMTQDCGTFLNNYEGNKLFFVTVKTFFHSQISKLFSMVPI